MGIDILSKLKTIAYVVGITIAISSFSMLLYSFLPIMIYNNAWDNQRYNNEFDISEDEILEKFKAHPVYVAFYEKYPDAVEEFKPGKNNAELELGVANFDTNSYLKVHFGMSPYDKQIHINSFCDNDVPSTGNPIRQRHADGIFVKEFIEITDCVK